MRRVTPAVFHRRKADGETIAMLTAYDYPSAKLADEAGVDGLLVGDSAAMAVMGRPDTLSVTVDELLHHVRMVTAAAERALVVADLPFLSYHIKPEETLRNAGRFIAEGGAGAVKLEGPMRRVGESVDALIRAGIPVMGHLGLIPQSLLQLGGYKVQGRKRVEAETLERDALELQEAGCFAVVLECIPGEVAREITSKLSIPTIGIGAGGACDGQILVMHDILGWGTTRFAKTYADVRGAMGKAFADYVSDVRSGAYPAKEHEYE